MNENKKTIDKLNTSRATAITAIALYLIFLLADICIATAFTIYSVSQAPLTLVDALIIVPIYALVLYGIAINVDGIRLAIQQLRRIKHSQNDI